MTREEFLGAWASIAGGPPNSEQLAIMEHIEGPLQIIAGPGVGKTYALILRVLFLLCVCHVAPSAIVLTTFTRKAAEELRLRLQEAHSRLSTNYPELRAIDLSQMRLGTLHSLCWDILTEVPGSRYRHLQPLGALEQAFFIYTTSSFGNKDNPNKLNELDLQLVSWIDKKSYRSLPSRWQWVKIFTSAYERLLNDQIDRTSFAEARPIYERLVQLVEEYETALSERHFTDQTLIQQQALELLRSPEGNSWIQSVQYVVVDEYQDTNPLQATLYRALAAALPHNLCVVGDDDQALYRFRGGTVGCLVHFAEECRSAWPKCSVRQLSLVENYRSQPAIVDWCNDHISIHPVMSLPNARVAEKIRLHAQPSSSPTSPAVVAITGKDAKENAFNFVTTLRLLKEQGVIESYAHCALLAHSIKGEAARVYTGELQQQGISIAGFSLFKEQQVYKQILGTLFLALDRSKNLLPSNFAAANAMGWPHFRGVRELGNSPLLLLIGHWTQIAQRRMTAFAIVKHFDVLKDRPLRLLTALIGVPVRPLAFERTEKRLHGRVIVAIPFAAHAHHDPCLGQLGLIGATGILAATIRMMQQTTAGMSAHQGHVQGLLD